MARYPFLVGHLLAQGFKVYPHEMICGSIGCPYERNRFVDVAAKKEGCFYAFEYKSVADYLPRALQQVENYRQSFDYVIVVAEIPRNDISVNLRRGVRIKEFLGLGAGIWTVKFDKLKREDAYGQSWLESINPQFEVLKDPSLQSPDPRNREWVELKFEYYGVLVLKHQISEDQKRLIDY